MAAKRIYQLAKEFERDEKDIIAFLTAQGIKVGNRLSAVSDDIYNLLKAKYTAPPPPPEPEPEPEPVAPPAADATDQPAPSKKKKKKKKKAAQPEDAVTELVEEAQEPPPDIDYFRYEFDDLEKGTQAVYKDAIAEGNAFITDYNFMSKKRRKDKKLRLARITDPLAIISNIRFDEPDSSPVRYWNAVNKLVTGAFNLVNDYGVNNRAVLGEMRDLLLPLAKYEPREIFTDEENKRFEEQQLAMYRFFGHGMTAVNDNLFAMKMHAERMKLKYEFMDFVSYVTKPDDELREANRVPFIDIAHAITFSISGIARRHDFYRENKERIANLVRQFFEWLEGYAKLKEQGAPADKLEKYLELQQKLFDLIEFVAFDNLIFTRYKKSAAPCDKLLEFLNKYRDNMDDPDAKRDFQYKARGVTNIIYKPKEFTFLYNFADLELKKDYRPPEMIAAELAAQAAQAVETGANEESPAAVDEA